MDKDLAEKIALHRYAVIAEALPDRLTPAERGQVVRAAAAGLHSHPDGSQRRYSRGTIDRWLRAWRADGVDGLMPKKRADAGTVRTHPELFEVAAALRREMPGRSSAQIAEIIWRRHDVKISPRTVRGQLARAGLSRQALGATAKTYGRYEAQRPNQRWIADVLVDPWVPFPRVAESVRAKLFLIVDDHSRLLVHGRFMAAETARAGQHVLRQAISRRGLPEVLYCDNGAPYANAALTRTCAVLGVALVHSKPYSPEGRGKQERLNRYIRERFLTEATHVGIDNLHDLNDRFDAWAEQVANRRIHTETGQTPADRWAAGGPHRQADPATVGDAFRWAVTRKVTKTATISIDGRRYQVDTSLVGLRIEARFDPEDLTVVDIYHDGRHAGPATAFVIGNHSHPPPPPDPKPDADPTGIDYLGMVQADHEDETVGHIHYANIPLFDTDTDTEGSQQ